MPDTRDTNPDEVFAAIAVAAGFVSEAQRDECLQICNDFRKKGLAPRSFAKIAYEKRYLTRAQIKHIQREMRARGIHTRLGGYELLERIGSGAMGKVYQARQLSLDRIVALKVLHRDLGRDKRFVARLRREAKLAARISHPNVVQVFDVGRDQGRHFLVMEFVEGVSLKDLLEQGPLDERRAIEIVRDVAKGLSEAHAHDIIHRDIKPGNIMLRFDGVPKLSDLGIALDAGSTTVGTVTGQGAVIGTPQYMSPEQCSGAEDIDYRTDIYSLGVTFFRMVCGHDPFEGPAPLVVMQKHMAEPLPDPRSIKLEISPATAALIMDMTCKDREERIQTCQEVVERCDAILAGQTEAVPRPRRRGARVITGVRAARARVVRTVRMASLVVVLLLGAGIAWYMTRPPAYENWMLRAKQAEQSKDWDTALQCYQEARTRAGKKAQIDGDIERVKQRMELSRLQQQYGENEANGDRYRNEKRWDLAESAYE
jgi:tRNA A-37 threonylcarbamoyl transferase component Bud32